MRSMPQEQKTPFYKNPYFVAAVIAMVTLPLLRPFLRHIPEPPLVLAELPDFELQSQDGESFSKISLDGKVTVFSFTHSRCGAFCDPVNASMLDLQRKFSQSSIPIQLVSVSVDPEHDSTSVLKAYAEGLGVDFSNWKFVTGAVEQVEDFVERGFRPFLPAHSVEPTLKGFMRARKIAIVDGAGGLRGFYNTGEMGVDEVLHRSQHVFDQQRTDRP